MSKFKVGDKVRVTNKRSSFFDEEGIIKDDQSDARDWVVVMFEKHGRVLFAESDIVIGT